MLNFRIEFTGKWPSVNDLRNKHWTKLHKLKKEWEYKLVYMIRDAGAKPTDKFGIEIKFNSKLDADNISLKFFCDTMRAMKLIKDDNKKYFRYLTVHADESLPKNTYIIDVISL